jgi:hypothetical protein
MDVYYYNHSTEESIWEPPAEGHSKWDNTTNNWATVAPQQQAEVYTPPLEPPQQPQQQPPQQQQQPPQQQPPLQVNPDLYSGGPIAPTSPGSTASSPRGNSQRNSRNFGMDDAAPQQTQQPQQPPQIQQPQPSLQPPQQQFVPTTAVVEDTQSAAPPPPPPTSSTTPVEAWSNIFDALQASGKKIQSR